MSAHCLPLFLSHIGLDVLPQGNHTLRMPLADSKHDLQLSSLTPPSAFNQGQGNSITVNETGTLEAILRKPSPPGARLTPERWRYMGTVGRIIFLIRLRVELKMRKAGKDMPAHSPLPDLKN